MLISKGKPQRFPELKGRIETIRYPVYVEKKIDGITNWLNVTSNDPEIDTGIKSPYLINGNGKILSDLPITREIEMLPDAYRLLGELYCDNGKAGDFYKLKNAGQSELKFMVFDIDIPGTYEERSKWLDGHIKDTDHIKLIRQNICTTRSEVDDYFEEYVGQGYEGIVVKSFDSRLIMGPCPWVKIKNKRTLDLHVAGIDPVRERIDVWVVLSPGHRLNIMCGVKVSHAKKKDLRVGDIVEIEHQGILSNGNLRHPVFLRKRDDKCAAL